MLNHREMPEVPLHCCQLCPHESCDEAVVTHLPVWDGHPVQGLVQGLGDTQGLARSCWGGVPPVQGKLWGSGVAPLRGCGAVAPWGCWAPRLE